MANNKGSGDYIRDRINLALTGRAVVAFYTEEGLRNVEFLNTNAEGHEQYRALCPFPHGADGDGQDDTPSFNFTSANTGWFTCHACKEHGDIFGFYTRLHGVGYAEARDEIAARLQIPMNAPGKSDEAIPPSLVEEWNRRLVEDEKEGKLKEFIEKRGIDLSTIIARKIGWDGERYTIPIADDTGTYVNVRRYSNNPKDIKNKMLGYGTGYNEARLYPFDLIQGADKIILCEGEWDALLTQQHISRSPNAPVDAAITVTTGAGIWADAWGPLFADKVVFVCFDLDETGADGARKVAASLRKYARLVYIATLPQFVGKKGDLTDYFHLQGQSMADLLLVLQDAQLIEDPRVAEEKLSEIPPENIALSAGSQAANSGKKLRIKAFVSGKDHEPYTIPKKLEMTCTNDYKLCGMCQWNNVAHGIVDLTAKERNVLSLINTTDTHQEQAIREVMGIPKGCGRCTIDDSEKQNIEELRLITDLDTTMGHTENDSVVRRAFVRNHGIQANRPYYFIGYVHADPTDQHAVHLIDVVEPAEDSISDFAITEDDIANLRSVFSTRDTETPIVALNRIAAEMAWHVHGIHGRELLQTAYDLVFHSVLAFQLGRKYVRKGWVEGMVAGDTGMGKLLAFDEKIFTPSGWKIIGDSRVGDKVFGEDGVPHKITGVYPQGVKPIFEITFSDGATVRCGKEHRWAVNTPSRKHRKMEHQVLTLEQIMESGLYRKPRGYKWFIPITAPVQLPDTKLPVAPYTLGALLGDGGLSSSAQATLTTDRDIADRVSSELDSPTVLREGQQLNSEVSRWGINGYANLRTKLSALGLVGTKSGTKFIPRIYLHGSIQQRLDLLRGLMDTDGCATNRVTSNRGVRSIFSSSSPQLMADVQELVESLGGTMSVSKRKARYRSYLGEEVLYGPEYTGIVNLPVDLCPFWMPRKRTIWESGYKVAPLRAIKSVRYVGDKEAVCISTDNPTHLYLTAHFAATHNSDMIIGLMHHYRVGEKINGENVTLAGVLAAVEKMGDRWILSWGKVPQNDRRMLVIDELGDMDPAILAALSDVRTSGIAEVTKVVRERTPARTRLLFLANPREGRPLSHYPTGVDVIKSLVGKNEDIRRLDFAMTVRSKEIPDHVMQRSQQEPPVPLTATSDLCRQRVLWAWSRKPDQVVFGKDTEAAVFDAVRVLGSKFHASFPLCEPADLGIKVARMSAALAAATFATPDGVQLVVEPRHVADIIAYLTKVYDDMGYGRYSQQMQRTNDMDEARFMTLAGVFRKMAHWEAVVNTLSTVSPVFNKKELQEMSGLSGDQADLLIREFGIHGLIGRSRAGYLKNPALIALFNIEQMRIMDKGGPVLEESDIPQVRHDF